MGLSRFSLVFAAVITVAFATRPVAAAPPPVPEGLPRYQLDLTVSPKQESAKFRMRVTWTNRHKRPTDKVVFNFYPHYRVPKGDLLLLSKTLELLRLHPSVGIEPEGGHGKLEQITLVNGTAEPAKLSYQYREDQPTVLTIDLPRTVNAGESITIDLIGSVRLPEKQGRWGQWQGVTYMTHALPMVAYYDEAGWKETPFVPWHQPFWNEAGIYNATITLPKDHVLGCSAAVQAEADLGNGWKRLTMEPFVGRDFALTCSALYQEFRSTTKLPDGRDVTLKCVAYPKHEFYARTMLQMVADAIPVYSQWFGAYPYSQFTIAESYFGWNGNECSGMVLIDERVFAMPHLGRGYVEYLVSHETCHQWWYNLVGTNGYSETWIDEGAATYYTHKFIDGKHGKNNQMLDYPSGLKWLPNIQRDNYRFASWYGALRRDETHPAAGDLPSFGHLYGLFSGAYDRGSKIFHMIEGRLGEEASLDFMRGIVKKYSFEMLSGEALKQELEAYTGRSWDEFYTQWVHGKGLTDWQVKSVQVMPQSMAGTRQAGTRVEVVVRQTGELNEPTTVGFQLEDGDRFPVRIPVGPVTERIKLAEYDAEVEPAGPGATVVRLTLPKEPVQVTVDPDQVLLDANPANNKWKNPPKIAITPLYTMLNETDLTNDWDRWNIAAGPWVWGPSYQDPWYTRSTTVGARAGMYRTQTFAGGVYTGFRSDYRDLVVGADGLWDHFPHPRTQLGFNIEQRVGGPYFGSQGEDSAFRAALYGRYVLKYGSSLYLPPMSYVDAFTTYQDNFLPYARVYSPGSQRPGWTELTGLHFRLNLYTPYWDPERGFWVDLTAAGGPADLGPTLGTFQAKMELAGVQKLPEGHGYWSDVKLAGRVVVQGATRDQGQFFALGGGTLFRGFDLAERQGSFLWVVNKEIRFPILCHCEHDVLDHTFGLRGLTLAVFSDTGAIYTNGRSVGNVAEAMGVGLRADLSVFSFIERATVRFDMAKTINAGSPMQFWFGIQHPF